MQKRELRSMAVLTASRMDALFYKLNRAAAEYVNRKNSLDEAVSFAQEGNLAAFVNAYVSGIELNVQITNPDNKIIYQSWDALRAGKIASKEQQGFFQPKIIELNKSKQFSIGLKVLNHKNVLLGYVLVASRLNEHLINEIKLNLSDSLMIGVGKNIVATLGTSGKGDFVARAYLKILPTAWVDIYRHPRILDLSSAGESHLTRNFFIIILLIIFLVNGYFIWISTNRLIIEPVLKIKSVIIDNEPKYNLEDLPDNEIGKLGRALFDQKNEIELKTNSLSIISQEFQKEAAIVKVLTHDLSTPLTIIKISIEKIKRNIASAELLRMNVDRIITHVSNIDSILSHVREMKALIFP